MSKTPLFTIAIGTLALTACSTTQLPQTIPANSLVYDESQSYAQNLGKQFGILRIPTASSAKTQFESVKPQSHLMRNLGVTLLANSPLQGLGVEVSKGSFSTGVGLDFFSLGWKSDTVYFEGMNHWFAFVSAKEQPSLDEARSYALKSMTLASGQAFEKSGFIISDVKTNSLELEGGSLREEVQMRLIKEDYACTMRDPCSVTFTLHHSNESATELPTWVAQNQNLTQGDYWKFWATSLEMNLKKTPNNEINRIEVDISANLPQGFVLYFAPQKFDKNHYQKARLLSAGHAVYF